MRERRARILAVAFLATVVVGPLSLATFAAVLFFAQRHRRLCLLLKKSADVIQSWRGLLPAWIVHTLPTDADALQSSIVAWLKEHLAAVQTFGQEGTRVLVRIVIGMVIGALIALRQADPPSDYRPIGAGARQSRPPLQRSIPPRGVRPGPNRRR